MHGDKTNNYNLNILANQYIYYALYRTIKYGLKNL